MNASAWALPPGGGATGGVSASAACASAKARACSDTHGAELASRRFVPLLSPALFALGGAAPPQAPNSSGAQTLLAMAIAPYLVRITHDANTSG